MFSQDKHIFKKTSKGESSPHSQIWYKLILCVSLAEQTLINVEK
jgi:hypothetical protein